MLSAFPVLFFILAFLIETVGGIKGLVAFGRCSSVLVFELYEFEIMVGRQSNRIDHTYIIH